MTTFEQIKANIALTVTELTNSSTVAIFSKIAKVVGDAIDNTSTELINSQNIISNIIGTQRYGKAQYYLNAALAYQVGVDMLIDANGNPYYASVDTTKLLISQASFMKGSATVGVKVAKLEAGLLAPLTSDELAAFNNYMQNFAIPGIVLNCYSYVPNILSFNLQYNYYGGYNLVTLKQNLSVQIANFRNSFSFNGELFMTDFSQFLQANVPGTRSAYFSNTVLNGISFLDSTMLASGYFNYLTNIESIISATTFNAI